MSRLDFYMGLIDAQIASPATPISDFFRKMLRDLDGRISDTESGVTDYRAARQNLEQVILTYLSETLEPEFDRIRAVADLGLLFEARSSSLVTVGAGRQTFVVRDEDKGRFSAPGYIGIFKLGDPGVFMAGVRVSYDKASGTLVVDIDRVAGGGVSAADWQIVAVSGTDYLEAAALAEAARDLAEQYRTESRSARDDALAHSGTANSYRMAAEEAKGSAQTAQALAEDARDVAGEHLLGVQAIATHYLGPGESDPSTQPGGGALATGDLYWNTTASEMRTWNGSAWGAAYVPGGADVVTWNGRTGAVTPADGDYSASQVTVSPSVAGANRVQAALAALETAVGTKFPAASVSAFMQTVLDDADAAAVRTTLGAAAASHPHAWGDIASAVPGTISSLAGGTAAADKVWVYSGAASGAFHTVTAFARSLLDDADAATALATLGAAASGHGHSNATTSVAGFMSPGDKSKLDGVAAGANNYAHPTGDGNLHVPANGTGNANKVLKAAGTAGSYAWGSVAYGEIAGLPSALSAIDGLTPAADRLAYYTSGSAAALAVFTALARSLLADTTQPEMLATIGAAASSHSHANASTSVSGFLSSTDKSKLDGIAAGAKASFAWSEITAKPAALDALDALTPAADRIPYYTGPGTGALAPFSAFGRTLVANADAAATRADLGLGSMALEATSYADWQLAAASTSVSGSSNTAFTGLGAYAELLVCFISLSPSTATNIRLQVGSSGGWVGSGAYSGLDSDGALIGYLAANEFYSGAVHVIGLRGNVRAVLLTNAGNVASWVGSMSLTTSPVIADRIRVICQSGTFDNGQVWIWGKI